MDHLVTPFIVCQRPTGPFYGVPRNGVASSRVKDDVPGNEVQVQPSTGIPICPEYATEIAHNFEPWEINQPVESGFQCANLTCGIIYIEGHAEGFYTLEPNGDTTPYPKPGER